MKIRISFSELFAWFFLGIAGGAALAWFAVQAMNDPSTKSEMGAMGVSVTFLLITFLLMFAGKRSGRTHRGKRGNV